MIFAFYLNCFSPHQIYLGGCCTRQYCPQIGLLGGSHSHWKASITHKTNENKLQILKLNEEFCFHLFVFFLPLLKFSGTQGEDR